ncbi:putative leucine-rich repeat domain, L domain-containing protein [Lupinus albus]|uniref:Putative leucine-rich repeat domain, L domain-containing protein n=1 Tax=Lupinus albus TaxID=3870 RepID=A0A6A4NHF0_LUPAL|nr:putative leucine-rich repeat domain, L domain-containing protein [Lupinus albus]
MKVPNLSNRSIGSKNTHCAGPLYKQMIGSGVGGTTSAFYRFNQASATCRKWRQACCKHLHTLSFSSKDWPIYCDMTTTRLEILITQTIFQTSGLQALSILMEGLEILDLAHNSIAGVKPNYQRFPCLKYLSLSYVSISALDLHLLVSVSKD